MVRASVLCSLSGVNLSLEKYTCAYQQSEMNLYLLGAEVQDLFLVLNNLQGTIAGSQPPRPAVLALPRVTKIFRQWDPLAVGQQ